MKKASLAFVPSRLFAEGTRSEGQVFFHFVRFQARQGQVGVGAVKHAVKEDAVLVSERAGDVVLLAQRDEDVFDLVVQPQRAELRDRKSVV